MPVAITERAAPSRRGARGLALAGGALLAAFLTVEIGSENLTLNAYFPAPLGVYANMMTTGDALLARDGGKVGVGTASPSAKLDVNGMTRFGNLSTAAAGEPAGANGMLYYNTASNAFRAYQNGAWGPFGSPVLSAVKAYTQAARAPGRVYQNTSNGVRILSIYGHEGLVNNTYYTETDLYIGPTPGTSYRAATLNAGWSPDKPMTVSGALMAFLPPGWYYKLIVLGGWNSYDSWMEYDFQ